MKSSVQPGPERKAAASAPKRKAEGIESKDDKENEDVNQTNTDQDAGDEDHRNHPEKPAPKKRKSKASAAVPGGDMVLAQRTAVQSLSRAIHVGAHVSGAGGEACVSSQLYHTHCAQAGHQPALTGLPRCSQLDPKRRRYWRQRLRPISQVAA